MSDTAPITVHDVAKFGPQSATADEQIRIIVGRPTIHEDPNGGNLIVPRYECQRDSSSYTVSGRAETDGSGEFVWRSSDLLCRRPKFSIDLEAPISFLAAAHNAKPRILTPPPAPVIMTSIVETPSPDELVATVFSWNVAGERAPYTSFSYWCRIPYEVENVVE